LKIEKLKIEIARRDGMGIVQVVANSARGDQASVAIRATRDARAA
jgi:hypothetical protein